jgi:amino acid transporter
MPNISFTRKLAVAQFLFLTLPLYFGHFTEEAIISFTLICLYLIIEINIDFLFRIAKVLKWTRTSIILTGFFGIKNIFFILCLILFWKSNLLYPSLGIILIITINYALHSFALGRKLLTTPYDEDVEA